MKILFMGTPVFAAVSLNLMIEKGLDIIGVLTQPDKPRGRGHKLSPSPVKELAARFDIPVYQPVTLKNGEFMDTLAELAPDLIIVVAYGKILPKAMLDFPKYGCINVHASLLPKYRGAAPIQQCIIDGQTQTGITTMLMADGIDTGDMLIKRSIPIAADETAGQLHDRLATLGAEVLIETIDNIGQLERTPQNDADASYAPMITKQTGHINWNDCALNIVNLIRGLNPHPCAYCVFEKADTSGKMTDTQGKMKVISAELGQATKAEPGEVTGITDGCLEVAAGDGVGVLIKEIQFEGAKCMSVKNYLNGHKLEMSRFI